MTIRKVKTSFADVLVWMVVLSTVGCTPVKTPDTEKKVVVIPQCPPILVYTPKEKNKAADEIEKHPDLIELPRMVGDLLDSIDTTARCWSARKKALSDNDLIKPSL